MKLRMLQPLLTMNLQALFAGILFLTSLTVGAQSASPATSRGQAKIAGVGSVIDPAGDCRISGTAERLAISIPGNDHALDIDRNNMDAPRVLQEVSGDFTAEVTVSGAYPESAETVVESRRPFQGAGLLLWVDARTYIRLERAHVQVQRDGTSVQGLYPLWELRLEGKWLRGGSSVDGTLGSPTSRLRISRTGNQVVGAISEDGKTWRELDPLTLKLPEKVQIGLSASHNTTSPFEAKFEGFTVSSAVPSGEGLIGAWVLVGTPGEAAEHPGAGRRLQFFTGRHWVMTQSDANSGKVVFHHGGTYTSAGNRVVKNIEYANENTAPMIKQAHTFEIKVQGDTFTQVGIDNPFTETWKRLK